MEHGNKVYCQSVASKLLVLVEIYFDAAVIATSRDLDRGKPASIIPKIVLCAS